MRYGKRDAPITPTGTIRGIEKRSGPDGKFNRFQVRDVFKRPDHVDPQPYGKKYDKDHRPKRKRLTNMNA